MITQTPPISRPTESEDQRERPLNASLHCRLPTNADYAKLLDEEVPGDLRHRTYLDLIAEEVFRRAINVDIGAADEITEAIDGKVSQERLVEARDPQPIEVIVSYPKPTSQNQQIDCVPSRGGNSNPPSKIHSQ